jgi:hypothetical protein
MSNVKGLAISRGAVQQQIGRWVVVLEPFFRRWTLGRLFPVMLSVGFLTENLSLELQANSVRKSHFAVK